MMPPTFALLIMAVLALPAFAAGVAVGAGGALIYFYRRGLRTFIKRDR